MTRPKILVFANGTATGGASGLGNLIRAVQDGQVLVADIVGVASTHEAGGARKRADKFNIPFFHFAGTWDASRYQQVVRDSGAEWVALSGWLRLVTGLDPRFTINIHPGPLPETRGMYGHRVHEAVVEAFHRCKLGCSAVCMHFVTPAYDEGPVFFRKDVQMSAQDTPESLGSRVNSYEHEYQPAITNLVVHREIRWDGRDPNSLKVPCGYWIHHRAGEAL